MSKKQEEQYRCKVQVKRTLTVDEVIDRMDKYSATKEAAERREQRREADNKSAKADISDLEAQAEELLSQCKNKYETSTVEAVQRFNRKKGSKRIYHYCPGNKELHEKFIREEPMTEDDFKLLPLGENLKDTAPGAPQADGSVKDEAKEEPAEEAKEEEAEEAQEAEANSQN